MEKESLIMKTIDALLKKTVKNRRVKKSLIMKIIIDMLLTKNQV